MITKSLLSVCTFVNYFCKKCESVVQLLTPGMDNSDDKRLQILQSN